MKLTILIPVYNTEPAALLEAIHCLLNQDDKTDYPILIIDDGSTDEKTHSMIRYLGEVSPRISAILTGKNEGTSAALNEGHRHIQTECVALMGSDDICDRSRLRLQMDYLKRHPETDVLGTNLFSFHDHDIFRKPLYKSDHKEIALGHNKDSRWLVNHGTVVYRNKAVHDAGLYNESFRRGQDVELWGRMKAKGYVFRNITEVLYGWRRYK